MMNYDNQNTRAATGKICLLNTLFLKPKPPIQGYSKTETYIPRQAQAYL